MSVIILGLPNVLTYLELVQMLGLNLEFSLEIVGPCSSDLK